MQELDDNGLLREYAENQSEEAFATLVARHINKVYSAALRHTRNPSEAEEITQAVFTILAKKARRLGKGVVISGWLYQTARLASVTYLRSEIRRAHREQEAHTMQTILNEPDETWVEIAPLLDAAMAGLNETDRHAVVLRFFDGKSVREVGAATGATEDAAKKRLSRALERLQRFFARRGVHSTTAIIAGAISGNSVQAAPAALAKSVTVVAMTQGAAAGSSSLVLVKGALKVMAWTKAKTAIISSIVILLATGAAALTVREHENHRIIANPAFDPWENMGRIISESYGITSNSSTKVDTYNQKAYEATSASTNANGTIKMTYKLVNKAAEKSAAKEMAVGAQKVLEVETNYFKELPTGVVIRKHLPNAGGVGNGFIFMDENHAMVTSWSFARLLANAYGTENTAFPASRIILPTNPPAGDFDYLINVPDHGKEQFQAEIKRYFGMAVRFEAIETNALFLNIKNYEAPGLRDPTKVPDDASQGSLEFLSATDMEYILGDGLRQPVVVDHKAAQRYWVTLPWLQPWRQEDVDAVKKNLLEDLGLEFMPTNMPVEMLVVEKAE